MKSKLVESKRFVAKLYCDSWNCRACAARKKQESGRYVAFKLLLADGVGFESASAPDEWDAQKKALRRKRAEWVRYGPLHLSGVIIGLAPSPFGKAFYDREAAIIRLGVVIREMKVEWKDAESRCRPVNYSRGWTPPKRESKYEMVNWVRVKNPTELVRALNDLGICARTHTGSDTQWDVTFAIPPDMPEVSREKLKQLLSCPH